jgi:hypothetical protein
MEARTDSAPPPATAGSGFLSRLGTYAASGIRFWELAIVVLGHFLWALPVSRHGLSFDLVLGVFLLAVVANVAYCVAYLFDLFVQLAGMRSATILARIALLLVGTAFAAVIAHFISGEMFPS